MEAGLFVISFQHGLNHLIVAWVLAPSGYAAVVIRTNAVCLKYLVRQMRRQQQLALAAHLHAHETRAIFWELKSEPSLSRPINEP